MIKKIKDQSGQQLLELCIVLPILIIILGFLITGGQLSMAKLTATHGAYEAARGAVVCTGLNEAKAVANSIGTRMMDSALGNVTADNIDLTVQGEWKKGNFLTCDIETKVTTLFPVIGIEDDGSFRIMREKEISSQISMMIENE